MKVVLHAAVISLWSVSAHAAPIPGLFGTGVDAIGQPLTDNATEPHYTLISGPVTGTPFVKTSTGGHPIPPWLGDSTTSAWIAPTQSTFAAGGTYTYRLVFDMTGLVPATAFIAGEWSTDASGADILINGSSTGNTAPDGSFQVSFFPFSINDGFVSGTNTLDFVVVNGAGPTGLRVNGLSGTADPIPEPSGLMVCVACFLGLSGTRGRRPRAA